MAAASIAQVHQAQLRDGRDVAVKVQRPGIRATVIKDLEALAEIAAFVDDHTELGRRFGAVMLFDEFRQTLLSELDFRREANNLMTLARNLEAFPDLLIPQPVLGCSAARVLTMDLIRGTKITSLGPLAKLEIDGFHLAETLFRAYLKQILADGFFHADPHPGKVFLVDNRIALIDLGMVARISPQLQDRLLQYLLAVSDNRPEDAANVLLLIGECRENADQANFRRALSAIVTRNQNATLDQIRVGRALLEVMKIAGENGIRLPRELAMIGKTLLNLDQIAHTLAPGFDPNAAVRRHAAALMDERAMRFFAWNPVRQRGGAQELRTQSPGSRQPHSRPAVRQRILHQGQRHRRSAADGGPAEGRQPHHLRAVAAALIVGAR